MRAFETKSLWDAENQEWFEEYYIDGELVDFEIYDEEKELETVDDGCNEDCDNCCGCEDNFECDCPNCTIEKYVDLLMTDRCEDCTREILKMFMGDIIDHIVVED